MRLLLAMAGGMALNMLLTVPVQAKEGDTVRPFVSYTRQYDSNLFRLDEGEGTFVVEDGAPLPVTSESGADQYGVLSAGLNVDWQPGRQNIQAHLSKSQVRFSRYRSLDYDGSDYQLRWNWRLGNYWNGLIAATENVTQTNFSDLNGGLQAINNQVTRDSKLVSAGWQFHPRWNMGFGTEVVTASNSTVQQAPLDGEDKSVYVSLGYATPKGSSISGQVRRVEGEFPNRVPGLSVEQTYTQTEYNLLADWNMGGKLVTHMRVGRVERDTDNARSGFSSWAGRLTTDYITSGKTQLNWAVYRELSNSNDINASYQINTGTSVGAAWLATTKLTLQAGATFENRSFRDDSNLVQRDEDTLGGSLSMRYTPVRLAAIDVGLQAGRRDSNIANQGYRFHGVFVNVRADF